MGLAMTAAQRDNSGTRRSRVEFFSLKPWKRDLHLAFLDFSHRMSEVLGTKLLMLHREICVPFEKRICCPREPEERLETTVKVYAT